MISTEEFVLAVQAGDLEKAGSLYAPARMCFERSEPVAESFGDLDPRIDARLADLDGTMVFSNDCHNNHHLLPTSLPMGETSRKAHLQC